MSNRVIRSFWHMERVFPSLRPMIWRLFYNTVARSFQDPGWVFMNYGYKPEAHELEHADALARLSPIDYYSALLYQHTVAGIDIAGKDLLEVGSGRGGGCAWLARHYRPKRVVGLDLAARAIQFCQKTHNEEGLEFVAGNAQALPFDGESFDHVINVESCHHYPSIPTFLAEVERVLRPNATFCLTDYRNDHELAQLDQEIERSPFSVYERVDITEKVVLALQETNAQKEELLAQLVPRPFKQIMRTFAGGEDSDIYRRMASRKLLYITYRMRKNR